MSGVVNPQYKLVIKDCILSMCEVTVSPEVLVGHSKALKIAPAQYTFMQSDLKVFAISKSQYNYVIDNLFLGEIPTKLYVFLVASEAFNGSYSRNPFNLLHCNLNSIGFTVDGKSVPHCSPYKPNFQTGDYMESYLSLMNSCGKQDTSNGVTIHDYSKGYCIHCFDVDCLNDSANSFPKAKQGHTRLSLSFASPLTEAVNLVVYGKFPRKLSIDHARGVIL